MKQVTLLCFSLIMIPIFADSVFKRTFFTTIPSFGPTSPEIMAMNRDRLTYCCDHKKWFDLIIEGGTSTSAYKLAEYFSPQTCNCDTILVGELGSNAVKNNQADVIANYFNILTDSMFMTGDPANFTNYTFESKISFKPTHTFFAAALIYHQHISKTQDRGWWFEFVFPLKWVKNSMHLKEDIINSGGPGGNDPQVPKGYAANMTQAFKQSKFKFGKIDGSQTKGGIADPQIKLGYTYFNNESYQLASFWGAFLPTSNKPTGEYMFEPIYGNNSHLGIFAAIQTGFRIWRNCERSIHWELATSGMLLLKNNQVRSFDLKDKTWGRYIWVYTDATATTTTAGINAFTKEVSVDPGTSRDLNIAFVYECPCFRIEGGYNYYGRQAEKVELTNHWNDLTALASIIDNSDDFQIGKNGSIDAISRDRSTISDYLGVLNDNNVDGNAIYRIIKECDLDLNSAAHPGTTSHIFYAAGSYHWGCCDRPKYIGLGIMYDNGTDNTTLNLITIWTKFGMTF